MNDVIESAPKGAASALKWLWLSLLVLALDQGSKQIAIQWLNYGEPVALLPFFDLTLLYNKGAAFSFLASQGGWQRWFFAAVAVAMSIYLLVWLKKTPPTLVIQAMALSLILGGAVGNLIDRVLLGYVVDFISLHWQQYYYPAFNIADSAITVGAVLLIWDLFLVNKRGDKASL